MESTQLKFGPINFSDERQNALSGILHAANLIKKHQEKIFEQYEINQTKFTVLQILKVSAPLCLSQMDIRAKLTDSTIDLPRVIKQLHRLALVKQVRSRDNRRVSEITITPRGVEVLRAIGSNEEEMKRAAAFLSDEDIKQLIRISNAIERALNPGSNMSITYKEISTEHVAAL